MLIPLHWTEPLIDASIAHTHFQMHTIGENVQFRSKPSMADSRKKPSRIFSHRKNVKFRRRFGSRPRRSFPFATPRFLPKVEIITGSMMSIMMWATRLGILECVLTKNNEKQVDEYVNSTWIISSLMGIVLWRHRENFHLIVVVLLISFLNVK